MNDGLASPVIFLVFNRPALTRQVFERIAGVKPSRLLIVADGPRPDKPGEAEACEEVRRIVSRVDWPCKVDVNFAPVNLGCRQRIVTGLNWAFGIVEEAIILEDDILPDQTFFYYCDELLARYRDDQRISMITGFNISDGRVPSEYSYYFSRMTHIWGWATWRRSWIRYDPTLSDWPEVKRAKLLEEVFDDGQTTSYWTRTFEGMHANTGPNTWDYQWVYTNFINGSLSITPQRNLIENIGFGPGGTHITDPSAAPDVAVTPMKFPLTGPPAVIPLRSADRVDVTLSEFYDPTILQRVIRRLGFKSLLYRTREALGKFT